MRNFEPGAAPTPTDSDGGGRSSFAKRNGGSIPTAFWSKSLGRETGEMLSGPPAAVELTQLYMGHVV